ncbi:MAG: ATP-binding protein, partial [Thermoanaerobaculia bacterium]
MNSTDVRPRLHHYLKELCLPTVRECVDMACEQAGREGLSYDAFLVDLLEREVTVRSQNRIERLLLESKLPLQ